MEHKGKRPLCFHSQIFYLRSTWNQLTFEVIWKSTNCPTSFLFNRVASMPRWETPTARLHSTSYTSSLQHRPAERSNNCWGVRHTDGWNNGLLVHRWMDGWKHKRMDGLNGGFMDGRIDGWIDACMGEWRGEWFPNLFSFYYIHRYIQNKICT